METDDWENFTLVFKGDIRKFAANPLKAETPFGVAYAVAAGDALQRLDNILSGEEKPKSYEPN